MKCAINPYISTSFKADATRDSLDVIYIHKMFRRFNLNTGAFGMDEATIFKY